MPMSKAISIVMIAFAEALEHDPRKVEELEPGSMQIASDFSNR
ncbi:hypothetical protein ACMYR2_1378 [Nitrobacter sp. TKz-YC01]